MSKWRTYEETAAHLLDRFATEFGLKRVEGKQNVAGLHSGNTWEIDAKGFQQEGSGFLIVEVRRYTTSKLSQEKIGALAYRITDTGAGGGIIVSPLGLQEGAERLAKAENILNIRLSENSTPFEFTLLFLNKIMVGVSDTLHFSDSVEAEVRDIDGNVISREQPR